MKADDPTLPSSPQASEPTLRAAGSFPSRLEPSAAGELGPASYQLDELLGRGGMGEVLLARDARIGRSVAIKRMRDSTHEADVARFLREARIQARLDHPAIVPVYELGQDAQGCPYFTMKRITGETLAHTIANAGASPQRMLRTFVEICLAVAFAHRRGIVHRDLKPSNIMLGDFGEVYILDWGVARELDEPLAPTERRLVSNESQTVTGSMLGTPGYMAPEQVRGETVGCAADVYALGAILFEMLVREPLHPPGLEALSTTLEGNLAPPSRRKPEAPPAPELEQVCMAALASDPASRPSARELADRVQTYLDGDRDVELRRTLAVAQLAGARDALASGDRARAMLGGGRALALDPTSPAADFVMQLMLEPPHDSPPALRAELQAADAVDVRRHAHRAALAHLAVFPLVPLAAWNGIQSWSLLLTVLSLSLVLSIVAWSIMVRPERSAREMTLYAIGNAALIALMGRVLGPFLLVPGLACLVTMSMMAYPAFARRNGMVIGAVALGWLVPIALEQLGILPKTWAVVDGAVVGSSSIIDVVSGIPTIAVVFATTFVMILLAGFLSGSHARALLEAKHQLVTQAWHLRQLLPPESLSGPPR